MTQPDYTLPEGVKIWKPPGNVELMNGEVTPLIWYKIAKDLIPMGQTRIADITQNCFCSLGLNNIKLDFVDSFKRPNWLYNDFPLIFPRPDHLKDVTGFQAVYLAGVYLNVIILMVKQ